MVRLTKEIAPRSHNLLRLSGLANIRLEEDDEIFIGILMKYQWQGRYPDYNPMVPDKTIVKDYLDKTEKLLLCLEKK